MVSAYLTALAGELQGIARIPPIYLAVKERFEVYLDQTQRYEEGERTTNAKMPGELGSNREQNAVDKEDNTNNPALFTSPNPVVTLAGTYKPATLILFVFC